MTDQYTTLCGVTFEVLQWLATWHCACHCRICKTLQEILGKTITVTGGRTSVKTVMRFHLPGIAELARFSLYFAGGFLHMLPDCKYHMRWHGPCLTFPLVKMQCSVFVNVE